MDASPILLEPIASVKVLVPDKYTGDIMGDLNKRRGRVLGMNPVEGGKQEIVAFVKVGIGKFTLLKRKNGYSQSASLLAHNRMLHYSLSGVACTTPDTSKSPAYCFAQLKQGTCLFG